MSTKFATDDPEELARRSINMQPEEREELGKRLIQELLSEELGKQARDDEIH
jgi:hypothetical protein